MLADLCDAHVREKEYHAKVQNAYQDFHGIYIYFFFFQGNFCVFLLVITSHFLIPGTIPVYLRVKPALEGESVVEFTPENDPRVVTAPSSGATMTFGKLNGVFAKHESQGN